MVLGIILIKLFIFKSVSAKYSIIWLTECETAAGPRQHSDSWFRVQRDSWLWEPSGTPTDVTRRPFTDFMAETIEPQRSRIRDTDKRVWTLGSRNATPYVPR
jgi:hypothetical protein